MLFLDFSPLLGIIEGVANNIYILSAYPLTSRNNCKCLKIYWVSSKLSKIVKIVPEPNDLQDCNFGDKEIHNF